MSKEEVIVIAQEYAKKFDSNFLALATDAWYYDAVEWFDYNYGTIRDEDGDLFATPDEREWFAEEISKLFDTKYQEEYGLIDDYYYIKGIIYDLNKKTITQLLNIKNKYRENYSIAIPDSVIAKLEEVTLELKEILKTTNDKLNIEK